MSQSYTTLEQQYEEHKESFVTAKAILAAGLASATAALLCPYLPWQPGVTVIGTAVSSMMITASSSIYKGFLENATSKVPNTKIRAPRRLLVCLLAGLVAFAIGIVSVSSFEGFVVDKTPSVLGGPPITDYMPIVDGEVQSPDISDIPPNPGPIPPPPTVTIKTPTASREYHLNEIVIADYTCVPGGLALKSCSGSVKTGFPIDTSTLGSHTFTVTAEDEDGHKTVQSATYQIIQPPVPPQPQPQPRSLP
jgi:hypothetical protein